MFSDENGVPFMEEPILKKCKHGLPSFESAPKVLEAYKSKEKI